MKLGFRQILDLKTEYVDAREVLKAIFCGPSILDLPKQKQSIFNDAVVKAIESGNEEFLFQSIKSQEDIRAIKTQWGSIFHAVVVHREEGMWSFIHGFSLSARMYAASRDENNEIMLHQAAKLSPSSGPIDGSRAVLEMQRDIQWYKEIERITPRGLKNSPNNDGKTPGKLFTEQHQNILNEGMVWMKSTAKLRVYVAIFIAGSTFSICFNLAAANYANLEIPTLFEYYAYKVLVFSSGVSFYTTAASLWVNLSLHMSRYREEDFLFTLPNMFIIGGVSLTSSMTAMMVTFLARLCLVLWLPTFWRVVLASHLGALFLIFVLFPRSHTLCDMIISTYGSSIFKKPAAQGS